MGSSNIISTPESIGEILVHANLIPRGPSCHALEISGPLVRPNDISVLNDWVKHNRLRPEPIRFVRLDSEHALSDRKSMNRGLAELDLARGRDPSR